MTQTTATRRVFRVVGKDRLFDDWIAFQHPDPDVALRWAERRAFLLPDEHGNTVFEENIPIG